MSRTPIILFLKHVGEAPIFPLDKLDTVEHELSMEELDRMTPARWRHFDPADLTEHLLPTLGEELRFGSAGNRAVVSIRGRNYRVEIDLQHENERDWDYGRSRVTLTPTDSPATAPDGGGDYRFFGQPRWVQGRYFPGDARGGACRHLVTVENGWGDSGNVNILVGLDPDGIPEVGYIEASCC